MVKWINVDSSNIDKAGYEVSKKLLHVVFNNDSGTAYVYEDVPAAVWMDFISAESKGKFLHGQIKGIYSFEKREI